MDMRTFGKDYEKYLPAPGTRKASASCAPGCTRWRSPETGDLSRSPMWMRPARSRTEISPWSSSPWVCTSTDSTVELAKRLGVDLNLTGSADTDPFAPVSTSRPGVYTCGVFQGPKDIPAPSRRPAPRRAWPAANLAEARGRDTEKIAAARGEGCAAEEAPRVGVFVCNCGINIGGVVDVPGFGQTTLESLPDVVYTDQNLFTCSQDTQEKIKEKIQEHKLNRVVVASCSPKTHEPLFRETLEACGLNKYLFEMANIRNQNSWVHSERPQLATRKAKDLIRMAVARAATLKTAARRRSSA